MKRTIYILSILSFILLPSCEVEEGDYQIQSTLQGKLAFDQAKTYTDDIIHLTEMVSRVSLYKETPADQQEAIRLYYLNEYTLTENVQKKTISLSNQSTKWIFAHNDKPINEADALWTISASKKTDKGEFVEVMSPSSYTLTSKGDKTWQISCNQLPINITLFLSNDYELYSYMWEMSKTNVQTGKVQISATKAVAQAASLYNYTIQSGEVATASSFVMHYVYKSPAVYTTSIGNPLKMIESEIDMQVTVSNEIKDEIKATLKNDITTITMGGITESYNYYW